MSIKRSRQRSSGSSRRDDAAPTTSSSKPQAKEKSWSELVEGRPDEAFVPYSLDSHYAVGALIQHSKFGRGAVVADAGSFVVVVFADGQKKLGHVPG